MFVELNNILDFDENRLPSGQAITITKERGADCGFLLHHLVSLYLKGNHNVCFVACAQTFNHYNNVGNKIGVSLKTAKENGNLVFIEALKLAGEAIIGASDDKPHSEQRKQSEHEAFCAMLYEKPSLKPLCDHIKSSLTNLPDWKNKPTLLIIDDLTVLLSLGVEARDLVFFVQYLRQHVCPTPDSIGCLAVGLHLDGVEDEETDILQKSMCYQSTLIMRSSGLKSGYSKDVHGELLVKWPDQFETSTGKDTSRRMQYKFLDKNVAFFAVGLSSAVL